MIETLDDSVGRLLTKLDELKLARQHASSSSPPTTAACTCPSGSDDPPTHNTPFRAGKGFLYEGGLRVPLIVRWPGKVKAGPWSTTPVVNTDLMPTLLELAGVERPDGLDGVSLRRLLRGQGRAPSGRSTGTSRTTPTRASRPGGAVREGRWKLVEHYEDGRAELYDLERDPGETRDLSDREPQRVKTMKARLAAWRKDVGAQENSVNPDFDAALHRKLYVDTDVSRLKPAATAAEMTKPLAGWRQGMDEAARRPRP